MKCTRCGGKMKSGREDYDYADKDMDAIILKDALVHKCQKCGDTEVELGRIEKLHRVIAFALAAKPARLRSGEIRFLRTYLGFSKADFARFIGVDPAMVSRWENDGRIGRAYEQLIRELARSRKPKSDHYWAGESLPPLKSAPEAPSPIEIDLKTSGWKLAG